MAFLKDPFARLIIGSLVAAGLYALGHYLDNDKIAAVALGVALFVRSPSDAAAERKRLSQP